MTRIVFQGSGLQQVITAEGHAGHREVCVAVTFTLRSLAHVLDAIGALSVVEQTKEPPRFMVSWRVEPPATARIADEIEWLLRRLTEQYPAHLQIERADDVRHDRNRVCESA